MLQVVLHTGHTGRVYCIIVPFVSCCIILSYHSTGAALCWLRFFLVDHAGFALGFTVASFSYGMVAHLHSDTLRIARWFGHGSDTCFLPEAVATPSMIMDLHLKFERGREVCKTSLQRQCLHDWLSGSRVSWNFAGSPRLDTSSQSTGAFLAISPNFSLLGRQSIYIDSSSDLLIHWWYWALQLAACSLHRHVLSFHLLHSVAQ